MDFNTFCELNKEKSIEDKLELIYKVANIMACDAFNAGMDMANHNNAGYKYEEGERQAMNDRLRWLCSSIADDVEELYL